MRLPPDLLHRSPAEAARRITLAFLDEARAACKRLADEEDEEALHAFRVAVRRLRSTIRAWKPELRASLGKRHARALRKVQRATGVGRDAEVALAWLGEQGADLASRHAAGHASLVERYEGRLGAGLQEARDPVRAAFARVEAELRERLEVMQVEVRLDGSPAGPRCADVLAERVRSHVHDLVRHLAGIHGLADEAQAHAARIRGKRLRYLVEPVRRHLAAAVPVVEHCKRLQDLLGDLNDTHLLAAEVRRVLDGPGAVDVRAAQRAGLRELAQRLDARAAALFARLRAEWLDDGAAALVAAVEHLALRLDASAGAHDEFERKYLLRGRPALPAGAERTVIEQGYLPTARIEERVRKLRSASGVRYVRTLKAGSGLRRLEVDEEIPAEVFDVLWPLTAGRRLVKRRHVVPAGGQVWEIDEFLDRDLWLAEVEVQDPAHPVEPPDWLAAHIAADVTDSGAYGNRSLAR